jgi:Uma2 family endonuclease
MMNAVIRSRRHKLTVEDYHKLGEFGILTQDSRVELMEGELIDMTPIGGPHMGLVNRLTKLLVLAVGDEGVVSVQNPVTLPPYSEPQPDVAILKAGADGASSAVPQAQDVLLLIEVADTTLAYDRDVKLDLYARSGILETWIVNVPSKRIEVYQEPASNGYVRRFEVGSGDVLSPLALPAVQLAVAEVFA